MVGTNLQHTKVWPNIKCWMYKRGTVSYLPPFTMQVVTMDCGSRYCSLLVMSAILSIATECRVNEKRRFDGFAMICVKMKKTTYSTLQNSNAMARLVKHQLWKKTWNFGQQTHNYWFICIRWPASHFLPNAFSKWSTYTLYMYFILRKHFIHNE